MLGAEGLGAHLAIVVCVDDACAGAGAGRACRVVRIASAEWLALCLTTAAAAVAHRVVAAVVVCIIVDVGHVAAGLQWSVDFDGRRLVRWRES